MSGTLRVMVVDDTPEVRLLVGFLLEDEPRWTVVAEATDGIEAVERAASSQPDLVLLDMSMPRMDGLEALPRLRRLLPEALLVLLTAFPVADVHRVATACGADACLDKVDMALSLVPALRSLVDEWEDRTPLDAGGTTG